MICRATIWHMAKVIPTKEASYMSAAIDSTWLGIHGQTNEHRVALLKGGPVIKVRTLMRRPDSEKWGRQTIGEILEGYDKDDNNRIGPQGYEYFMRNPEARETQSPPLREGPASGTDGRPDSPLT